MGLGGPAVVGQRAQYGAHVGHRHIEAPNGAPAALSQEIVAGREDQARAIDLRAVAIRRRAIADHDAVCC
jgi:hypothetical protein